MNVRTVDDFEDALDREWSWRKQEMIALKLSVQGNPMMLRAGIALLCAHFEGLLKYGSRLYVIHISQQHLKYADLIDSFSAFVLRKKFNECRESDKISVHMRLLQAYFDLLNKSFKLTNADREVVINTRSNPSTKVIKEILSTIGIKTDIFDTKANYIDSSLLANRNKVVHGEKIQIRWDDFVETFQIIMKLVEDYKGLLIEAAHKKIYLKINNSNPI